ncbi:2,3-bisphosphoglycerate-independent phosphoglycerate mutase [Patescibacteria group bacterium]|nr:2,3-bisphosphoglycerate-independent phosphoglycerate mutase [Patescibacteria group bacterium]
MVDSNELPKPVVLMILDGWGIAPPGPGNAVTLTHTPTLNQLWAAYPHTQLKASGEAVGLPRGEDGNSETGHVNFGAGHIVFQDLPRISLAIADASFYANPAFLTAINWAKKNQSWLHLFGLIGAGGVHANNEHLFALLNICQKEGLKHVALQLFTDGRDSPPNAALTYLNQLKNQIKQTEVGQICSLMGRYYAMDRDLRWERTEKAYRCLTEGVGHKATSPEAAVQKAYESGKTDEFIEPTIITDQSGTPLHLVSPNDAVIFYNFRIDRPRQLTKAFILDDFETQAQKMDFDPYRDRYYKSYYNQPEALRKPFKRVKKIDNLFFVTMTEYERGLPAKTAFPPSSISIPLARVLSENNLRQLHLAETEKERFVTYYFNGMREQPFPGEDWSIIPSPDVPTYDLKPEMATPKIAESLIQHIRSQTHDFILVNFANPDMVGHTGIISAGIKACESVDAVLAKILPEIIQIGGIALITADHGNVEEMIDLETGQIDTKHSTNPVPFILAAQDRQAWPTNLSQGILADVAPTILKLLKIPKPPNMIGKSLI